MNTSERLAAYVAARTPKDRLAVLSADNPLLTPAQRRRLRKKDRAASTHSHADLTVVEVSEGVFKRVPCSRCSPLAKAKLIGG